MTAYSLPLRIRHVAEAVVVEDAVERALSYVYCEDDPQRRSVTRRVTRADAVVIAQVTARALTEAARNAEKGAPDLSQGRPWGVNGCSRQGVSRGRAP